MSNIIGRVFVRESAAPGHRIQMHDVPTGGRRRTVGEIVQSDRDRAALDALEELVYGGEVRRGSSDRRRIADSERPEIEAGAGNSESVSTTAGPPSADDLLRAFGLPASTDDEPPRFVGRELYKRRIEAESRMGPGDDRRAKVDAALAKMGGSGGMSRWQYEHGSKGGGR